MKIIEIFIVVFSMSVNLVLSSCTSHVAISREITEGILTAETPSPDLSIPAGWILFPRPTAESSERYCANWATDKEWKVATEEGTLRISKNVYQDSEQLHKLPVELKKQILKNRNIGKGLGGYLHVEPYENGWLIGSDAGEWGGKLLWFSQDGRKRVDLLNDNVRGIVQVGDKVLILSGLAHLGTDEGKIYQLANAENGRMSLQLMTDLKTQPQNFAVENSKSILITLNNKILRIKSSGEIGIVKDVDFNSLYPNSITVTASGVIYIGMRLFLVRLVPTESGYIEEWLVKENCQKFTKKDLDCVCANK